MAILNPTNLETVEYGTTGWNAIYSANFQKLNDYLSRLWDAISGLSSGDNNKLLVYNSSQGKWTKRNLTSPSFLISFSDTSISIEYRRNVAIVNQNITLTSSHDIVICSSNITITLPSPTNLTGKVFTIKNNSSGEVIIIGITPQIILQEGETVNLVSTGTSWVRI